MTVKQKDIFTKVVNHASKNDRIAWNRKYKKMKTIIDESIVPLENKILELTMQKMSIMDDIVSLRDTLRKECVHPREFLLHRESHILCKFCESKLNVNV